MAGLTPNEQLKRLRHWRNRPEPDLSLGFLKDQFQREVARPHKQLAQVAELWAQLVPAELAAHTRLISLSRGLLKVGVDSSPHLYELDRLRRSGLEAALIKGSRTAAIHKLQLVAESRAS